MARVSLNLRGITEDQLLKDANTYKAGLTGNTTVTGTTPTVAEYGVMISDAEAKKAASDTADAAAKTATGPKTPPSTRVARGHGPTGHLGAKASPRATR